MNPARHALDLRKLSMRWLYGSGTYTTVTQINATIAKPTKASTIIVRTRCLDVFTRTV